MCPKVPTSDKKWLYKTEYFDAFLSLSFDMLKRGYYVAHMQNNADIEVIIKEGGDHHPHGFDDNTPLIEFITKHY